MINQCRAQGCSRPVYDFGLCDQHVISVLPGRVPNEKVKELIESRLQGGRSLNALARAAGTSYTVLRKHLHGDHDYMSLKLYRQVEAVKQLPKNWNHPELLRRRLNALRAVGMTYEDIRREGGPIHRTLRQIMNTPDIYVAEELATRIRLLYDRHAGDTVQSASSRLRNLHLAPPAAWDDIDDLGAKPEGVLLKLVGPRETLTEQVQARAQMLIEAYGVEEVAERLRCTTTRARQIADGKLATLLQIEVVRLRKMMNDVVAGEEELREGA